MDCVIVVYCEKKRDGWSVSWCEFGGFSALAFLFISSFLLCITTGLSARFLSWVDSFRPDQSPYIATCPCRLFLSPFFSTMNGYRSGFGWGAHGVMFFSFFSLSTFNFITVVTRSCLFFSLGRGRGWWQFHLVRNKGCMQRSQLVLFIMRDYYNRCCLEI